MVVLLVHSVLRTEEVGGGVEGVDEGVDVVGVVVDVEAGPAGGPDAEHPHERLGAVVAGPDAHVGLVEHLADVVGVEVAEGERQRAAADLDVVAARGW